MTKPHFLKHRTILRCAPISPIDEEFSNEQVEVHGVIINRASKKKVDRSKTYAGLKSSDFSLQSQLSVGSIVNARSTSLKSDDLESFNNSVTNLENEIDNASKNSASE